MKTFNVYFLYNNREELLYIGKSISIKNRLVSHFSKAAIQLDPWKTEVDLEHIIIYHCNNDVDLDIYETYFINKYRPKYNKDKVFIDNPTFELPYLEPEIYNFLKEKKENSLIPYQESLKKVVNILSQETISEEDAEYLEATYLLDPSIKTAVDTLGTSRIRTLRYHKSKINNELYSKCDQVINSIRNNIIKKVDKDKFYSMNECKAILTDIYTVLKLDKKAKGKDILSYVEGKTTNKRVEGVLLQGCIFT